MARRLSILGMIPMLTGCVIFKRYAVIDATGVQPASFESAGWIVAIALCGVVLGCAAGWLLVQWRRASDPPSG